MRIKIKPPRKKNKLKSNWPTAYRWVAMGSLVAYSTVGSRPENLARAQDLGGKTPVNRPADPPQGSLPARRFEIAAGPLSDVLAAFEQVSGLSFVISKEGIRDIASPGVRGVYPVERALQKVLAETGVTYRFTSPTSVTIELKSVATEVEVTETLEALRSSPKYSAAALDTPQTISTVPQEIMQEQGTTTLRDALRNVAGISLAAGEGGAQGDNLTIRGFTARNDLFIDGMRDFGSYYRDPFNMQEVEVLQGPSSVTFGRGSTGGVVNQETKTPGLAGYISGGLTFGTDLTRRRTLDVDKPLLGAHTAFRLNLMGDLNNVAGRDVAENRRFGIAPSLAFGLGTRDPLDAQLFPSDRRRHSRLRHSVAVQWTGSGESRELLRLPEWKLSPDL